MPQSDAFGIIPQHRGTHWIDRQAENIAPHFNIVRFAKVSIFPLRNLPQSLRPNDTAISKYVRNEPRDREWIRAGLTNRILSLPTIEYRLRETIMESEERVLTNRAVEEDRKWLVSAR